LIPPYDRELNYYAPYIAMASSTTRALLLVAVAVATVLGTAHGASYTVGAPAGSWHLRTN
jgi:hypothetical protein